MGYKFLKSIALKNGRIRKLTKSHSYWFRHNTCTFLKITKIRAVLHGSRDELLACVQKRQVQICPKNFVHGCILLEPNRGENLPAVVFVPRPRCTSPVKHSTKFSLVRPSHIT